MDWVTRNMQEKETDPIKWAYGVGPNEATKDTPHAKRGRPFGSHTKWRTKEERELDAVWKELHRKEPHEDIEKWPGPFFPRKDFPSVRPAYWINCAYCGVLFCRPVTWVKSRGKGRAGHGTSGSATFCSIGCGKSYNVKPVFRVCAYCAKTFRVWANNRHKRTCCDECMRSVMSDHHIRKSHEGLVVYAFEHGIMADYDILTCDLCGAAQKEHYTGDPGNGNRHFNVRIALVDGKYIARCKNCYNKIFTARKRAEALLTSAEKLRRAEAKQLMKEVLK